LDVRGLFFFFDLGLVCALFGHFLFFSFLTAFFALSLLCAFLSWASFSLFIRYSSLFRTASSLPTNAKTTHCFLFYFYFLKKQGLPKKRNPLRPPLLPPHHTPHPRQHPHHNALNDRVHGELSGRTCTRAFTFHTPSFSSYNYKA